MKCTHTNNICVHQCEIIIEFQVSRGKAQWTRNCPINAVAADDLKSGVRRRQQRPGVVNIRWIFFASEMSTIGQWEMSTIPQEITWALKHFYIFFLFVFGFQSLAIAYTLEYNLSFVLLHIEKIYV